MSQGATSSIKSASNRYSRRSIMKNNLFAYILLITSIGACIAYECSQLISSDRSVTDYKQIEEFRDIALNIPGNIYFINSTDSMITIEGPESVVKNLSLSVKDNTLNVESEEYFIAQNWKRLLFNKAYELDIYIPVNSVEAYEVSGLGSFLGNVERLGDKLCIHSLGLVQIHVYQEQALTNDIFPDIATLLTVLQ